MDMVLPFMSKRLCMEGGALYRRTVICICIDMDWTSAHVKGMYARCSFQCRPACGIRKLRLQRYHLGSRIPIGPWLNESICF